MSIWKDFVYVDANYEHPTTGRRSKWRRIPERDLQRVIIGPSKGCNAFASAQRWKDSVSRLELKRETDRLRGKGSRNEMDEAKLAKLIAYGDDLPDLQVRYHGLFFDFDCDYEKLGVTHEEAVSKSKADAVKLADWFITKLGLKKAHVQCWFSGRKGFHVLVRPEPFGISPNSHLTLIVKNLAFELADTLSLPTLDRSVYTNARMWRIPNTTHPKTGMFKIELTFDELRDWSPEKIMEQARGPRDDTQESEGAKPNAEEEANPGSFVWSKSNYLNIEKHDEAAKWWSERFMAYEAYKTAQNLKPRRPIKTMDQAGKEYPDCVMDLMKNGPKHGGPNRNRVTLPIVNFMKDAGIDEDTATSEVQDWTEKFYPEPHLLAERKSNVQSVISGVYRSDVKFACRFIRTAGGPGEAGRVACCKEENCKWIDNPEDQEPGQIPLVHLSEASRGCYEGTRVRVAVHVATVARGPYGLPGSGTMECFPNPKAKICDRCPNNGDSGHANGHMKFSLDATKREVLNMVNVNDSIKIGTIKAMCGIPQKCFRVKIETTEVINVEEVQVIPMVDFDHSYEMSEDDDDVGKKSARHVVRTAYHLGHGIEANKKYIIEPTVLMHPKDQLICFLFDRLEPAQNDIDQFKMNDDLKEKLKIFQPKKGQSVEKKLIDIHADMTVNVHQIGGRGDLSIAVDLCYHSVIGFTFIGQKVNRGYFELVVVGDSGTGKSTMIERMMHHFGLGELIAGEDSKRTGLVYSSIQVHGQWVLRWGKIPQNDRRLLVIDEFAAMNAEEIGKLTQLRSEGRARGGGVNQDYETFARTRLICVTNPRDNSRALSSYSHGVIAVDGLYKEKQDLRRVDFAMIADKDDVDKRIVDKRWDKEKLTHVYTADLCRNLILWAWSRDPRHVHWEEGAEDEVIEWAQLLGSTYECDLPLAHAADLRIKIARISCAVAARMFSTDEDAIDLIVCKEHVQFAAKFMDRAYRKDSMSYFHYALQYKQDNFISQERKARIDEHLKSYGEEKLGIMKTLSNAKLLNKSKLADMVNLENDDLKRLWKFLVKERLLIENTRGWRRSEAFTKYLRSGGGNKVAYAGELSSSLENLSFSLDDNDFPDRKSTLETEASDGDAIDSPEVTVATEEPPESDFFENDDDFEDEIDYDEPDF
jgi:hypothetical protein